MRRRTAQCLATLYPPVWRARFGPELIDLLEAQALGPGVLWDVLRAAMAERLFNLSGLETLNVTAFPASVLELAKRPSGFIPVLMSITALALVIGAVASVGVTRQPDEGAAAHLFQLLVAGELPVFAFFVLKWLRKALWATLTMMAAQAIALALALFPVWYFGL